MHSRILKAGTAAGLVAGLVASSLIMAPGASAAEEETAGNNLAVPVIWSEDGLQLELRGDPAEPEVDQSATEACETGTQMAALQQQEGNTWQAQTELQVGNFVDELDWGDNLAKDWRVGQVVRIETALYKTVNPQMNGYTMCKVSGEKSDEMWGAVLDSGSQNDMQPKPDASDTTGSEFPDASSESEMGEANKDESTTEDQTANEPDANGGAGVSLTPILLDEAMIYTAGARLTIQRIDDGASPSWDADQGQWVGSGVADPIYSGAIHEGGEGGPGNFGSEINVSGKLVYGFIWKTADLFNGEYRVTFSLDGAKDGFPGSGTSLENASIRVSEEEPEPETVAAASMGMGSGQGSGSGSGGGHGGSGGEGEANTEVLLPELELSYVDVGLSGGEDPPVTPDPEPTNPPAPPSTDSGTSSPSAPAPTNPGAGNSDAGQPGAGVPVGPASPVQAQQRIRQRAQIEAPKSSKQRVQTRMMLTERPIFTDQGVTIRWRVTKKSQDNCTIRNRDGEVSVKFIKRGRCTVVAWAPSPNPLVYAPFKEKRIYKVRNSL